ncbi:MAG: hypothetical protein QOG49_1137, partial [Frankiaceae bacterium]|nr:hypothetical protein [Frankiaceae bacterium]
GPWVWPLTGTHTVSRGFDPPATRYGPGHRGADLPGRPGQPVLAAGAGRISYAGMLAGRGVVVVVHDGGLRTTYEPVMATVSAGAVVGVGDAIGVLRPGHEPARPSSGVLHWGLLRGETYLDPMSLLAAAKPVRLLPHWVVGPGAVALATGSGRLAEPAAEPRAARPAASRRDATGRPGLPEVVLAAIAGAVAVAMAGKRPP